MDELAKQLYESVREEDKPRVFEKWHASSIAECPRAHYFKRLGIPPQNYIGAGKMLRWQTGHKFEEVIRPQLEKIYPDLTSNIRLESEELDLTGEFDNYSEKEATIIEIKTVHDYAFEYRRKDASRFHLKNHKPYLNHELQNHCYALLLMEIGKPVEHITYVYSTLDGRIATYKTDIDKGYLDNCRTRLRLLNESWQLKTPPECICSENHPLWSSTMQYCDYRGSNGCCSLDLVNSKLV